MATHPIHAFDDDRTLGALDDARALGALDDRTLGVFDDASTLGPTDQPPIIDLDATMLSVGRNPTSLLGDDALTYGVAPPSTGMSTSPGIGDGPIGPLSVGQNFGWRYHIMRLLGIGGMGAVYQAWDAELGVVVAIKVIRTEITADPHAAADVERRFKRELLLARQVTHKNVVRIHDLGEIDGVKYITMSYVDGTDLATILKEKDRLEVEPALRMARSIVSGLVAAHAAGVVHRDLKPANIMIDANNDALIMDFGIASSTAGIGAPVALAGPAGAFLTTPAVLKETRLGIVTGTVQYMAPEQARGQAVDQRADIYAFGLILYDMLVGRSLAHGSNAVQELRERMEHAPKAPSAIVPTIPEGLDALVMRCIQPDASQRYQTSEELAADLDRLDETGKLIRIKRTVGLPFMAAVVVLFLALSGTLWWYMRRSIPGVQPSPVTVLIADFQNQTGDATFEHTLEPMLKRALEGASFISAYDRNGITRTLGVKPPERLDETSARELAVKQGLGVVLSGSIDKQGSGYGVTVKAVRTVTGAIVASRTKKASSRDQVLATATQLVTAVRTALGDETSESDQIFAMTSLSTTSLDVVRLYAAAQEASSNNKFEEVRQNMLKAVAVDPNFGLGYLVLASAFRNLGQVQDAEKYVKEALRHLDGMTERERFTTRGYSYTLTGDYERCVKEFGELIGRYPGDVVAHNAVAQCSSQLRDLRRSRDEMRRVVEILPNRVLFRFNLAIYSNYASDFDTGEREARAIKEPDVWATLAQAFAQAGKGQLTQAAETYRRMATIDAQGASLAATGLGDLAVYEGRFSDAIKTFTDGANSDLMAKRPDRAAVKFAALANAHILRGQKAAAIAAAEKALTNSKRVRIQLTAARSLVEAGDVTKARALMTGLAAELQAEPQAYAKIIEGEIALKSNDARQAIQLFTAANQKLDTWIGRFDLGRAYLQAGMFLEADSELDRCIKRRGEALSLFLDEEPTYGYFPPVYYYQGRVREGLQSAGFAESYRTYLSVREKAGEDPLLPEVRKRAIGSEPSVVSASRRSR